MRLLLPLLVGAFLAASAVAQTTPDALRHPLRVPPPADGALRTEASAAFDATYYHLQIDLDFAQERVTGTTRAEGVLTDALNELRLDLLSNMSVAAVRDEQGDPLAFSRDGDVLVIDLGGTRPAGSAVAVEVDYSGRPQSSGFGAFEFSTRDGQPAAWTLSEPYGARAWWPGKDHPSDKPDSARVSVTVPEALLVGSNGRLESATTVGGRTTYTWGVAYPIAPYLLSLAAGPYVAFDQTYDRPDSLAATLGPLALPVLHYKYTQGGTATLPSGWAEVLDALAVFEWWFGPYPFAEEKYGHAEFGWGGGMEHQTMSSMGGSSVGLVTHELAHQWFGDAVTTRTWPHLWLNEGFASYAEILYWEAMANRYPGQAQATLQSDQSSARSAQGTLVVQDTSDVGNLFAGSRVYAKGSAVLHMLRHVLGDEDFRATLQAYLADPALAYGTAETADLQRVAETVSGRSLDAFFRQWVTEGTGYPIYQASFRTDPATGGGYDVTLTVRQTQTAPLSNVEVFEMPIVVEFATADGARRFTVENTAREEDFTLHLDARPTAARLDPDGVLLRNAGVVVLDAEGAPAPADLDFVLGPNPTAGPARLQGTLPDGGPLQVRVVDALGRVVRTLWDADASPGAFRLDAALDGLAAGAYVVVLRGDGYAWTHPLTVVR